MSSEPSMTEIATDRSLWGQYVDPNNNDPEAFDRMTVAEKIALQQEIWPEEADMTAEQAIQILAASRGVNDDDATKDVVYDAIIVLSAAVLEASETGDPNDSLSDWIGSGTYTGSETVESIAAEWDEAE